MQEKKKKEKKKKTTKRKTCFQLRFRLRCGAAPTLLMTPVPCNFFSVANSDYRVGVKLGAKHHLFWLLFCARSVSGTGPAAVCLSSGFDEAVLNTDAIWCGIKAQGYRVL